MKDIDVSKNHKTAAAIAIGILSVAAVCMLFYANVSVPFMMDDIWYSTNLATGNTLSGFGDVIESQVWHYLNWGGRSITHAFLQLSLMCGERGADVINTLMTLVLAIEMSYLAKIVSGKKSTSDGDSVFDKICLPALMFGLLLVCCPNLKMSMLWQAGCANYVYSSVWILAFYIVYLRALDPGAKDLPLSGIFMIPLGLITGWSTENMGPSAFLTAAAITFMMYKKGSAKGKRLVMMTEGVVFSFVGSVICILAPGNFIRKNDSAEDLALTIPDRLIQMMKGLGDYLFPALLILAVSYILYRRFSDNKIPKGILFLLAGAALSYAAMIASPHYPDRAAFGTCVLTEICAASFILGIELPVKKTIVLFFANILMIASIVAVYAVNG